MMKVPTRLIWKTSTCLTLPSLARSTWYAQAAATRPDRAPPAKRGPKTALSDEALVAAIRAVLAVSPFTGEGYRKVWAKLRAEGIRSGKSRVLRLMGARPQPTLYLRAASAEPIRKKPGRTEYQRGIVTRHADGSLSVRTTGNQGSGVLSGMVKANGLIVLGHAQGNVAVGDAVSVMMFEGATG